MIRDMTLGQYFPGNSLIHKLDPRMKLILVVFYIVILFVMKTALSYALATAATVGLMVLSKIPFKTYFKGLKPLLIIVVFTGLINLFYGKGDPLVQFWIFRITADGIVNATKMILRIALLVISTAMLTYTTSPVLLTGGLERLLSPLRAIKVPVHEFSMMITIALRFIPTLTEETDKIISAQKARGADFESGNLLKRVKAVIPIIIPLFISSFRRADELAIAMECRCYNGDGKNRTRLTQYSFRFRDYAAFLLLCLFLAGVIVLNNFSFTCGMFVL